MRSRPASSEPRLAIQFVVVWPESSLVQEVVGADEKALGRAQRRAERAWEERGERVRGSRRRGGQGESREEREGIKE